MTAYYNEFDPFAAQWLRNLIAAGHIAPGEVDERSITEVAADDVRGYTQVHLFAGVGVWSYSLRLAGWEDDRHVWTGSCPCPPFSSAGKKKACPSCGGTNPVPHVARTGVFVCCLCGHEWFADERHLWPEFARLVYECRPGVVLGEQVASADGRVWVDTVCTSLEIMGYAAGSVDTSSAVHGAPHIRQRLRFAAYDTRLVAGWVEHAAGIGREKRRAEPEGRGVVGRCSLGGLANSGGERRDGEPIQLLERGQDQTFPEAAGGGAPGRVVDSHNSGSQGRSVLPARADQRAVGEDGVAGGQPSTGPTNGFWRDADWLFCRDGKWRPVEPGTFPLAHGAPQRVGRLRAYGNAVDAEATRGFIEAVMECLP